MDDLWYSARVRTQATWDEWGECVTGYYQIVDISTYVVVRYTPKGVWLRGFCTGEFFVLGTAIRQRAVPTKELALRDAFFKATRLVEGCTARLRRAEAERDYAYRMWDIERCAIEQAPSLTLGNTESKQEN